MGPYPPPPLPSEQYPTHPIRACGSILLFDPGASDNIHQTVAMHKLRDHWPQSHSFQAKLEKIDDNLPAGYVIFRVLFSRLTLHIVWSVMYYAAPRSHLQICLVWILGSSLGIRLTPYFILLSYQCTVCAWKGNILFRGH